MFSSLAFFGTVSSPFFYSIYKRSYIENFTRLKFRSQNVVAGENEKLVRQKSGFAAILLLLGTIPRSLLLHRNSIQTFNFMLKSNELKLPNSAKCPVVDNSKTSGLKFRSMKEYN